jgi:hypothetical protein
MYHARPAYCSGHAGPVRVSFSNETPGPGYVELFADLQKGGFETCVRRVSRRAGPSLLSDRASQNPP